jgi:hypothetical protein
MYSTIGVKRARNDVSVLGEIYFESYKKGFRIHGHIQPYNQVKLECFRILGDTTPYENTIKKCGGQWNGKMNSWAIRTGDVENAKVALAAEGAVIKE